MIEAVVFFMLVPSSVAFYEALGRVHTSNLFSHRQTVGFGELGEISPMPLAQTWVLLALTYSGQAYLLTMV